MLQILHYDVNSKFHLKQLSVVLLISNSIKTTAKILERISSDTFSHNVCE